MEDILNDKKFNFILKEILDNMGEGINLTNKNGQLLYVNKASARYAYTTTEKMIGDHISNYYPQAAILEVLETGKKRMDKKIEHVTGEKYIVNAYPLIINDRLEGAFAIFRDITEIVELNNKIDNLKMQININKTNDMFIEIIGKDSSIRNTILKAQKAVGALGGPRHCVISGESGTGKTMLAKNIYNYAKKIGVIAKDAHFIEVNCAQFTNPDIAAMEVFGSEDGAFTGSKEKKGLFELANGGMLFLDEAHALDHYQNILLKAIESGKIKRIGGVREINVNVIIVAASTKNLKEVFLPELYQRLAQYELYLPPLRDRSGVEKELLLDSFIIKYQENAKKRYGIDLKIAFSKEAKNCILNAFYPRNIRQFRDVVNASIDSAVPLIDDIIILEPITTIVKLIDLPSTLMEAMYHNTEETHEDLNSTTSNKESLSNQIDETIMELREQGLGPRKIAKILNSKGYDLKYYQIAYKLKKIE